MTCFSARASIRHPQIEGIFLELTWKRLTNVHADISIVSCEPGLWKNVLIIVHAGWKIKKENEISGLLKGKFCRPPNAPEARKERWCQSFSASHITWRADCSFHRPTFSHPAPSGKRPVSFTSFAPKPIQHNQLTPRNLGPNRNGRTGSNFPFFFRWNSKRWDNRAANVQTSGIFSPKTFRSIRFSPPTRQKKKN